MATLYSRPENKSRNMGYVASGLLTGILSARVISGYVGEWLGWRAMFIIVAVFMLLCLKTKTIILCISKKFIPTTAAIFNKNINIIIQKTKISSFIPLALYTPT